MTSKELLLKEIESIPETLIDEILQYILNRKGDAMKNDFFSGPFDLDALAIQQNVKPLARLEDLFGDFWPEDENIDDFVAQVRQWRDEEQE